MGGYSEQCSICKKWFLSRVALRQHTDACRNKVIPLLQANFSELELRALAYDGSFNHDPLTFHQHTCGVIVTGRILDYGCGHSWNHTGTPEPTNKVRAQEHMCPKCGKGPWFHITGEKK